jgi:1-acyl-sn-glycerol-3-phosphate acyltransferase
MKATKLQSMWIIIKSLALTAYYSAVALSICFFTKPARRRQEVDKLSRIWSDKILRIAGVSYAVFNPAQITLVPDKQYIIMSNHDSLYDIPLIFIAVPGSIRMITKKELFRVPLWGHAMKATEFIAIDRKNSAQAIKDLDKARAKMQTGIVLWIAPEGTRSRTGKLGMFKKGGFMLALQTGATIIPVGIRRSSDILPADTLNFNKGITAEIHIGTPIEASQYTLQTREQLMLAVEQEIRRATNVT